MTILFVCSGNTCRSPMAMALFRLKGTEVRAESAGIFAADGQPASPEAVKACKLLGADLSGHRSRRITPEIIEDSDIIAAMTLSHKMQLLLAGCPEEKAFTLSELTGIPGDIPDPFGQSQEVYNRTAQELLKHVDRLAQKLGGNT